MNGRLRAALRVCWAPLGRRAAQAYVAGPRLADALGVCRGLAGTGVATTLGFWNADTDRPDAVAEANVAALDAVGAERLDCYLSLKAPALGFSRRLLADVLERGRALGIGLHCDALGPETVTATFALLASALPSRPWLGCTLPARWRRSVDDASRAVELGLRVRVVKGQREDPGREIDARVGFLALIERLAGRTPHVGVATHDAALACEALQRLRAAATPCELELLYGLPLAASLEVAREAGVSVRLYVPYGHAWLPYRLSSARENPLVLWWAARDVVRGHVSRLPRHLTSRRIMTPAGHTAHGLASHSSCNGQRGPEE